MTSFKDVFSYMKEVADNAAHQNIYRAKVEGRGEMEMEQVDLVKEELKVLGVTERNIMQGVLCQEKFTRGKMCERGLELDVTVVVKNRGSQAMEDKVHTKQVKIEFSADMPWKLQARDARVSYSMRNATNLARDDGLIGRITSACNNLSDTQLSDLNITYAAEKMTQRTDFRHMFMKMYLMLMDLNLAATSKSTERRVAPVRGCVIPNISSDRRLGAIVTHPIVVDADGFTQQEIELLSLAAEEYPPVKFCGDNVYNTCTMERDDLRIVSAQNITHTIEMRWVPDSMYRAIISVACKLDCVNDWLEVAKMMRGRMHLMKRVVADTQDRVVYTPIPKSSCTHRALGGNTAWAMVPSRYPGYLSSSVALINDALLGDTYILATTYLVEQIGGIGKSMCQGMARTDAMYNGLLRDYGITTMSLDVNSLMMTWSRVGDTPFDWGMPRGWQEHFLETTQRLRDNIDVEIPQLSFECAHIVGEQSSWGAMRGWVGIKGLELSATKGERDESIKKTAAFLWAIGVRPNRPKVYANSERKGEDRISPGEYRWLSDSHGGYRMSSLTYTIVGDVGGRVDETEKEASGLIRTAIAGTRCSVIYADSMGWVVERYEGQSGGGVAESMGVMPTETEMIEKPTIEEDDVITPVTYGGSKLRSDKGVFSSLSVVSKPTKITFKMRQNFGEREGHRSVGEYNVKDRGPCWSPNLPYDGKVGPTDIVKYDEVETVGDPTSSIHAFTNALRVGGYVSTSEMERVVGDFDGMMNRQAWKEVSDIGEVAEEYGYRLRLFEVGEKNVVYEYGKKGPLIDMIHIEGRYAPLMITNSGLKEMRIDRRGERKVVNRDSLDSIKEARRFFRGMN